MPFDEIKYPVGLQTDIVGTGGSSGSPIVDVITEEVVGLAQNVFSTIVSGETNQVDVGISINPIPISSSATIGLTYGVCSNTFFNLPKIAGHSYKNNIPISSTPIEISGLRFGFVRRTNS